jgi:transposase
MGQASTIGLDIAKRVFQAHGADATGRGVFRKRLVRAKVLEFFAGQPPLSCGAGDLWRGALVGAGAWQAGPHGAADPAGLREAFRQAAEE